MKETGEAEQGEESEKDRQNRLKSTKR